MSRPGPAAQASVVPSVIQVSRSAFRGLVRFDTSSLPAGSTVISAVLKVYSLESKSGAVNVHPMWNEWTEASSRDDLSSWDASVLGSSDEVTANTWETIPLPASALDAPSWWLNFSKAGTVVDLASREDPAHAPQLIVTYADVGLSGSLADDDGARPFPVRW